MKLLLVRRSPRRISWDHFPEGATVRGNTQIEFRYCEDDDTAEGESVDLLRWYLATREVPEARKAWEDAGGTLTESVTQCIPPSSTLAEQEAKVHYQCRVAPAARVFLRRIGYGCNTAWEGRLEGTDLVAVGRSEVECRDILQAMPGSGVRDVSKYHLLFVREDVSVWYHVAIEPFPLDEDCVIAVLRCGSVYAHGEKLGHRTIGPAKGDRMLDALHEASCAMFREAVEAGRLDPSSEDAASVFHLNNIGRPPVSGDEMTGWGRMAQNRWEFVLQTSLEHLRRSVGSSESK